MLPRRGDAHPVGHGHDSRTELRRCSPQRGGSHTNQAVESEHAAKGDTVYALGARLQHPCNHFSQHIALRQRALAETDRRQQAT